LLLALIGLPLACSGARKEAQSPPLLATPVPDYRRTAETQYLPAMSPELAALVKSQTWFNELSKPGLDLIAEIQKCEKDAQRRGETGSVRSMLAFAAEQPWYSDGLDERETMALRGVFQAYGRSLADDNAPPVGTVLSTTLRSGLFEVLDLPETGNMVLLVSAKDAALGRKALGLAVDATPKVEGILGKFPYSFLHIEVTDDLPEIYAGLSYNEFIALATDSVDARTTIHEITHSTLYGIFPTWFEEGLAHFVEHYLTDSLRAGVREYTDDLRLVRRDPRLDIRNRGATILDELAERAQGFLLLHGIFELHGIESFSNTIRLLRTKTFNDQDLVRMLVEHSPPEKQRAMSQIICERVVGTLRNYCAPAQ
jgi:hypothetical protein